jgi:lactate dehydrogenase-like 2-hydroxyacid dehydrogenase
MAPYIGRRLGLMTVGIIGVGRIGRLLLGGTCRVGALAFSVNDLNAGQ